MLVCAYKHITAGAGCQGPKSALEWGEMNSEISGRHSGPWRGTTNDENGTTEALKRLISLKTFQCPQCLSGSRDGLFSEENQAAGSVENI